MVGLVKRASAVLIAGAISGSLLLSTGAGAGTRAAPTLHIDSISPNPVVVGAQPVTVTIKVTSDGERVILGIRAPGVGLVTGAGAHSGNQWTFEQVIQPSDPTGPWSVTPVAIGADGTRTEGPASTFVVTKEAAVKADTRIVAFRVHPRVALQGHQVYFSGRLKVLVNGRWRGLSHKTVDIVLKADGKESAVVSVTTNGRGWFTAHAKATYSGWYHASFAGDSADRASVSRDIFVKVFKKKDRHRP
jgi:hypothetical protein